MKEALEYEKDLFIDESALDVECLNQPTLMMRYSRAYAKAKKEVARLKEKLKVNSAILDKDIRMNPELYKLSKVTDVAVAAAIAINEEQQEIQSEYIDAIYEMDMLDGAIESIKQRKDMLQDLIRLHGQNYFAGPSIPRDLSHEAKKQHKIVESNNTIVIRRKK